jgi:hypothetical protein
MRVGGRVGVGGGSPLFVASYSLPVLSPQNSKLKTQAPRIHTRIRWGGAVKTSWRMSLQAPSCHQASAGVNPSQRLSFNCLAANGKMKGGIPEDTLSLGFLAGRRKMPRRVPASHKRMRLAAVARSRV